MHYRQSNSTRTARWLAARCEFHSDSSTEAHAKEGGRHIHRETNDPGEDLVRARLVDAEQTREVDHTQRVSADQTLVDITTEGDQRTLIWEPVEGHRQDDL